MAVKRRAPKFLHRRLAAQVKRRRTELKMSQEELATRSGLHRTYIGGIERAERNVSLATVEMIGAGLGVEPSELLK